MLSFMKIIKSLFFMQLIVMSSTFLVFAQQEPQKEYVQVVNAELILRVMKDGSPVAGLKKNDFSLYEDGEKSEINGFFEIHRRIAPADEPPKQPHQARLYLLFFWVGNPAADVEGVLNKFFSSIYREGDRVILSTPLKTFELPLRQDIAKITVAFLEQWRQEAKNGLSKRLQFHEDLNRLFEDLVRKLVANSQEKEENSRDDININSFVLQYSTAIQEYRLRELSPDVSTLEAMAHSLLPIKNDKFALVFFQHDTLPLFDIPKVRDHLITNEITDVTDELAEINYKAKSVFDIRRLSEQLKSLFIQANTQFHLLFLSPDRSDGQIDTTSSLQFTKSEDIFSNWDQVMQEISKNTGGLILDGDRMVDALDQVVAFEDIYYHITYVPREQGANKRKIDIRVNQPGMKVIYGRMLEMKDLPQVKIAEISATGQLICLVVADFYAISKDGLPTGFLNIYVNGSPKGSEPPRLLLCRESETTGTVELPFAFPQPGTWNLQVRVIDQITGQQADKQAIVEIAADTPASSLDNRVDPALSALLAKAAAYAEILKKAAFHFLCQEEVSEEVFALDNYFNRLRPTRNYWIYDYQIIGHDERIAENRVLLQKNRTKSHQEKAQLETMFRPLYSFYMPVTILAREKQHLYDYRLLGKEKLNKKKVWHVAATRRDVSRLIPWGEIWVSEEDGVVLKIKVEQTSIIGFEELAQKAREKGFEPAITIVHEYDLEKNKICFPSRTIFIERYSTDTIPEKKWGDQYFQHQGMSVMVPGHFSYERSRTYFEYKNYQFFSITTSVEEKSE